LDSCVVSYFCIASHSHCVGKTINHCSEPYVAILRNEDVSVDSCIGGDVSTAGDGNTVALDVENISMAIDRLEESDISLFDGTPSVEIKSCFS
jgi:hypothetical protein